MALVKRTSTSGNQTVVTFKVEANHSHIGSQVLLLGDFNNWSKNETITKMKKEGKYYVKKIKLENGKRYEFRYLSDNDCWFNDSAADSYIASPYWGVENGVVDLSEIIAPEKKTSKSIKDDLKKIEGIGPKIASILAENDIITFETLSLTSISKLEGILKQAGPRYSMHKPNTWPEQAQYAKDGKWADLKKWQEQLKGGR